MTDAMEKFFEGADSGLSLQVVFPGALALDAARLRRSVQAFDPSVGDAVVTLDDATVAQGTPLGVISWGEHVVKLVGFNAPVPSEVVATCVDGAHYPQDMKARVRAHASQAILYYGGKAEDPLEQYVALAVVAGALAELGGIAVLNETAHTSLPLGVLLADHDERVELLRALPLPMLFCGFAKYVIEDTPGVWMRTHGNEAFGLPDFAYHAEGHDEGQATIDLFANIMNYLRDSDATLEGGHTMQVGEDEFLAFRDAEEDEYWLASPGAMLVIERVSADDIDVPSEDN